MLEARVSGGERVVVALRAKGQAIDAEVYKGIARATITLEQRIKQKLTGQVLKVRTGTLRRSIAQVVTRADGSTTGTVSTNVVYGRYHEYGFKGPMAVKAHLRKITQAFGKSIGARSIQVRAHTRNVNYPPRSFMRTALQELEPIVVADLERIIQQSAGVL